MYIIWRLKLLLYVDTLGVEANPSSFQGYKVFEGSFYCAVKECVRE